MTNFEKWKETLTPEMFLHDHEDGGAWIIPRHSILSCSKCPVETCPMKMHSAKNFPCGDRWLEWCGKNDYFLNEESAARHMRGEGIYTVRFPGIGVLRFEPEAEMEGE